LVIIFKLSFNRLSPREHRVIEYLTVAQADCNDTILLTTGNVTKTRPAMNHHLAINRWARGTKLVGPGAAGRSALWATGGCMSLAVDCWTDRENGMRWIRPATLVKGNGDSSLAFRMTLSGSRIRFASMGGRAGGPMPV
jgi:hypothetical protein